MILRNINGVNLCLRNEKVTGIRDQECKSNICCTCTFALWIQSTCFTTWERFSEGISNGIN